jgi:DNA-binding transcriptional LysR family regulator
VQNNALWVGGICYEMIQITDPLETSELLAFAKTIETRSLSRAAAELGVPRATIGRRLARLEERLGARLLRRTTRSLALTDAGSALYEHALVVLEAVSRAEQSVRKTDDTIRGDLRVSVPPIIDDTFFEMLNRFAEAHPLVRLYVHLSSRHVDLQRDGYDVALRAASSLQPGLVGKTLVRMKQLAVASPAYIEKNGGPRTIKDLRQHRCLVGYDRGELPRTHWMTTSGQVRVEGSFYSNEVRLLSDAALRGLGIAFLPLPLVQHHLAAGALVPILPGVLEIQSQVALVYPEREHVPAQVRAFIDAVTKWTMAGADGPGSRDEQVAARCQERVMKSEQTGPRTAARATRGGGSRTDGRSQALGSADRRRQAVGDHARVDPKSAS